MRRASITAALVFSICLPLVVQPAPSSLEGPVEIAGGLYRPDSASARSDGEAREIEASGDARRPEEKPASRGDAAEPSEEGEEKAPSPEPVIGPGGYLENGWLIWDELMPEGWNPAAIFDDFNINDMADDDPRVEQVIEDFLKRWNDSPVNPGISSKRLKIPGFVVPLDFEAEKVDEFFLVPFFGACIHVPPPPPNQIILVRLEKPIEGLGAMEVVWVYGKISVEKVSTEIGSSGYSMAADKVEFYETDGGESG